MSAERDPAPTASLATVVLLIGALIAGAIFYGGGGVYFSDVLNERALDGASRQATPTLEPDVEVVSLDTAG